MVVSNLVGYCIKHTDNMPNVALVPNSVYSTAQRVGYSSGHHSVPKSNRQVRIFDVSLSNDNT